jgi:enolase-phosphatase E1
MTVSAILTDIEGTTSSIDFVHQVLFPYAGDRIADFVREQRDDPQIAAILDDARSAAGAPNADIEAVISQLQQWIAEDRKVTALKSLQGRLWERGYVNGDFTGHVYDDAVICMRKWFEAGLSLYVYSSGSVQAQQLLFGNSDAGDLRPLFSGYFDTRVGQKRDSSSYREIATMIAVPANDILFLSDVFEELDAARDAGMATVQLVRDAKVVAGDHRVATDFSDITP